jgi:prepilin-type N-terminal cleavage/methylation domain-containing protein
MLLMHDNSGFTLLELLISIVILSTIMIGLHQAMNTALSAHHQTTDRQEQLARARYAMERMVMFVRETDQIEIPAADNLVLNERVLDTYDNDTYGYTVGISFESSNYTEMPDPIYGDERQLFIYLSPFREKARGTIEIRTNSNRNSSS